MKVGHYHTWFDVSARRLSREFKKKLKTDNPNQENDNL